MSNRTSNLTLQMTWGILAEFEVGANVTNGVLSSPIDF